MFLKICHYEERNPEHSPSYTLYEGKIVEVIYKDKLEQTPIRFIIDGVWIDIDSEHKKSIYIMNNEGKTIEKIDHFPTGVEKQKK